MSDMSSTGVDKVEAVTSFDLTYQKSRRSHILEKVVLLVRVAVVAQITDKLAGKKVLVWADCAALF